MTISTSDDRIYFSIERADPRRILFVHEERNRRDLLYYQTALDASNEAAFVLEPIVVEQVANVSPSKYAVVVLSDVASVPGAFEGALQKYVRGGGAVLIALGRMSATHPRVPIFDQAIDETRYASRRGERFQTIASVDPSHPAVRREHLWDSVKFYQTFMWSRQIQIVARLSDNTPRCSKQIGEGRVLVFASTFDNISNDFPLHRFVPFVAETASYLGGLDDGGANILSGYLNCGPLCSKGPRSECWTAGHRAPDARRIGARADHRAANEGFYDVRRPSGRRELIAVNADRRESDGRAPAETATLWRKYWTGGSERLRVAATSREQAFVLVVRAAGGLVAGGGRDNCRKSASIGR